MTSTFIVRFNWWKIFGQTVIRLFITDIPSSQMSSMDLRLFSCTLVAKAPVKILDYALKKEH